MTDDVTCKFKQLTKLSHFLLINSLNVAVRDGRGTSFVDYKTPLQVLTPTIVELAATCKHVCLQPNSRNYARHNLIMQLDYCGVNKPTTLPCNQFLTNTIAISS